MVSRAPAEAVRDPAVKIHVTHLTSVLARAKGPNSSRAAEVFRDEMVYTGATAACVSAA